MEDDAVVFTSVCKACEVLACLCCVSQAYRLEMNEPTLGVLSEYKAIVISP